MKIGKIVTGGMFVGLVIASNIIAIPVKATPLEPDWMNGGVTYKSLGKDTPLASKCTYENRKIKPAGLRVYDESDPNTTKLLCVYRARGFEYAYYRRAFLINPTMPNAGEIYEDGVAFSEDETGDMTPSKLSGDNLDRMYTGSASDVFIYQVRNANYALTLRLYHNPLMHMHINSDGFLEFNLYDDGYFYLRNDQGRELSALGGSVSSNGKYLAIAISGNGLGVVSLEDAHLHLITDRFDISGIYPPPSPSVSVNANGSIVVVGGANIETAVYGTTSSCGAFFGDTVSSAQNDKFTKCASRNLSSLTTSIGAAHNRNGYPELLNVTLTGRGDSFMYTDNIIWYAIYAPNYIAPDSMDYLALGDSYSSGEGDIDQTGSTHYLSFTNVFGNYRNGIPRELCHVSDRSYPFLLAADMGISRGDSMQSIACAGAVRSDVLTIGASQSRDLTYLGQPTPLYDSSFFHSYSAARLGGLSNATALQDGAMQNFIPGRVQQVETVRKYKPKVATIGISGNDIGFGPILLECLTDLETLTGGDCSRTNSEGLTNLGQLIKENYKNQLVFYNELKQASPGTDFYAVGYPQFIGNKNVFCAELAGTLSVNERTMIRNAVTYLNQTIKNAAAAAGIKYIDIENVITSQDQDMCSQSGMITGATDKFYYGALTSMYRNLTPTKENESILEYYILTGALGDAATTLTSPMTALIMFMQEAFHPNSEGHKAIYDYIHEHQNGTSLLDDACDGTVIICPAEANSYEPVTSSYFGTTDVNVEFTKLLSVDSSTGKEYLQVSGISTVERGRTLDVYMKESAYNPGVAVQVELRSNPLQLASTTAGVGGGVLASVTIPDDIPVGYHELSVIGVGADGRNTEYIESIFVTGSADDIDGDGIKNTVDTCEFITPSGIDTDGDGIDDSCDLNIAETAGGSPMGAASSSSSIIGGASDAMIALDISQFRPSSTTVLPNLLVDQNKNAIPRNLTKSPDLTWILIASLCFIGLVFAILSGWYYRMKRE